MKKKPVSFKMEDKEIARKKNRIRERDKSRNNN